MPSINDIIKEKVVEPALKDRHHMTKGKVVSFNNVLNRANVEIDNPYGSGKRTLNGVPVQLGSGGVHSAGPAPGKEVWITYLGGNIYYPRIVALADENYQYNTREDMRHMRKGALIPDSLTRW